jgi:hypothetical protein
MLFHCREARTPSGQEFNFIKGGTGMKSIFSKYFIILCASALVLGIGACKQAEEPAEVEVEEVEVDEVVTPADPGMAEPSAETTVQDTSGTEVEVDEVEVDETVESVQDAAPDSAADDAEKKAQ